MPRYSWFMQISAPVTTQNIGSVMVFKSVAIHGRLGLTTNAEIRMRYSARKTGRY